MGKPQISNFKLQLENPYVICSFDFQIQMKNKLIQKREHFAFFHVTLMKRDLPKDLFFNLQFEGYIKKLHLKVRSTILSSNLFSPTGNYEQTIIKWSVHDNFLLMKIKKGKLMTESCSETFI